MKAAVSIVAVIEIFADTSGRYFPLTTNSKHTIV